MEYQNLTVSRDGAIATVTFNRPEKANTLRLEVIEQMNARLGQANADPEVRVIVLEGAGDNFCGGFDFSGGLEHYGVITGADYDPGLDVQMVTDTYLSYVPKFMGLWRGSKPTIAKVHGYCVGGGSELALCADLVVAAEDARFGTPYSRVWGCHLTGMWVYRLGAEQAKRMMLTGDKIDGKEAERIGLVMKAVLDTELDDAVEAFAERMASVPVNQLMMQKMVINQAIEAMGLAATQRLATVFDGITRHSPEGINFKTRAEETGWKQAVDERDRGTFDWTQNRPINKPQ